MSSHKDFHGGRSYSADPSDEAGPGIGFNFGLTFAWVKMQLGRLLGSASSPADLKPISPEHNSPFSTLGDGEREGALARIARPGDQAPRR